MRLHVGLAHDAPRSRNIRMVFPQRGHLDAEGLLKLPQCLGELWLLDVDLAHDAPRTRNIRMVFPQRGQLDAEGLLKLPQCLGEL